MTELDVASAQKKRLPHRVRHELRFRKLYVQDVIRITRSIVRITIAGDELEGFESPGFDDNIKVFFPDSHGRLLLPIPGPDGPVWAGLERPVMRNYTPRRHDAVNRTLQIDFALHEAGPAASWAASARPGDIVGIGGPRGSFIVSTEFDWHLLIGDETALPAISRRLYELPMGVPALVLVEVEGEEDEISFDTRAELSLHWVYRRGTPPGAGTGLLEKLKELRLPQGDFHAWVGCESALAKALRAYLIDACGANPKWVKASGYWRRGAAGAHDSHDD